ncbi:MAG: cytochrome P450 [Saprospiraceae bacterium]|nr:cytochrome P450 [Saprospiraceae bacterium]
MKGLQIDGQQVTLDVREEEFYRNPYPYYSELQRKCPAFYWKNYGVVTFTRHTDIDSILRSRKFGRRHEGCPLTYNASEDATLEPFFKADRYSLLNLEAPEHGRLRSLVQRAFINANIQQYEQYIVELGHELCDAMLVRLHKGEAVDLIRSFAEPIPVMVIAKMLGIGAEAKDSLLEWSHAMVRMYEPERTPQVEADAAAASTAFMDFLEVIIEDRRQHLADDLISHLIRASEDGEESISREEMISTIILLLNAGHEATVHSIANGAAALMQHPKQLSYWRDMCLQQADLTGATAELLRYDTPLHIFNRYVLSDTIVAGQELRQGQIVSLILGAGNRDEEVFNRPHELDLLRSATAHLSFGRGVHFCLGAPLARLEVRLALKILFQAIPGMRLSMPPVKANTYHFQGHQEVMVCI